MLLGFGGEKKENENLTEDIKKKEKEEEAKNRNCSEEFCPFWATVVAQHGGSVKVDPIPV